MRFTIATFIMLIISSMRISRLNRQTIKRGATVGLALGFTNLVFVFGISGTTISRAGILNNLFVLFIPLLAKLFWRDRIGGANIVGIILSVFGIGLLAAGGGGFNTGDLVSTLCAFCIAVHILTVSKVLTGDDDIYLISLVQFAVVAIMSGTLALSVDHPDYILSRTAFGTVVYCAVFPTVLCFTLQNAFQRYTTATRAGLIYTLDPVWSLMAGFFVLNERLTNKEWLGSALLFVAVLTPLLLRLMHEKRSALMRTP